MTETRRSDTAWAWAGALLAAGVSVAVNIAHAGPHKPSAMEVRDLLADGLPVPAEVGSWGFAAFSATLPVMVLIAAEQVARRLLGRSTVPVMVAIGVCAYSLSFWHTVMLLRSWGEPRLLQMTGAVAVDGLAVASVIALWFAARPVVTPAEVRTATEVTFRRGQVMTPARDPEVRVTPAAMTPARDPEVRVIPADPEPGPEVRVKALGRSGVSGDPGPRSDSPDIVAALQAVWTPGQPLTREVRIGVMTSTGVSESTVKRVAKTLQVQTEETR